MAAQTNTKEKEAKTDEIKNKVKITDAGPCKKKISIEVPAEKISKALDEQYDELRRDAVVPGFRKGRAPRRLLEKRFGKDATMQVKAKLLLDASESAIKDNEIESLGEPDIDPEKIEMPEDGPMKFDFEIEVRPTFDLPSLEGISVEKPKLEVTDQTIEDEIAELTKRLGTWMPKDGKVAAEDQIIADVVLKPADGDEEKVNNAEIHVNPRGLVGKVPVEKLDELLIGTKAGDTKTTSVDVPATFYDENYRGKKVDVEIKINDVKQLAPAKLDDAFFKRFSVENKEKLVEMIRERHEAEVERHQKEAMRQSVRDFLLGKVNFDLPADVVAAQSQDLLKRQYTRLLMQGVKAEDLQQQMEQLRTSSDEQAKEQLKSFFIMDAIATKLDIQTTQEEINGYIAQAAMYRQVRPEKMREQMSRDGSLTQVALEIREIKCIDKILESAKVSEVKPSAKAGAKTEPKKAAAKSEKKTTDKATKKTTTKAKADTKKAKPVRKSPAARKKEK